MSRRVNLGAEAREFANTLQDLLNKTVCDHAQVRAVTHGRDYAIVGTRPGRLYPSKSIRMRTSVRTKISIEVTFQLRLDKDEGLFLAVQKSYCGVFLGDEADETLLHYDFERDKERYSEAHIQVCARHETFEQYCRELGRKEGLGKIHLPVGGRRLRPALEDLIECLIVEGLVDAKAGWRAVLDRTRKQYRLRQVSAVVRRNPGAAINELRRLGYAIATPPPPSAS